MRLRQPTNSYTYKLIQALEVDTWTIMSQLPKFMTKPLPWSIFEKLPVLVLNARRNVIEANRTANKLLRNVRQEADMTEALYHPDLIRTARERVFL
ncbi:MAG: hypothetical protein CBB68_15630 [Rhodospirillaceae bacterium TMED8]|nr:MAG: hypothetical protein CBB68_15630 [Rhodospirillaceae bacterium TMED8]